MRYKNRYYSVEQVGGGKNRAKGRQRRILAISKQGTKKPPREFDEPRERQIKKEK